MGFFSIQLKNSEISSLLKVPKKGAGALQGLLTSPIPEMWPLVDEPFHRVHMGKQTSNPRIKINPL